MVLDTFTSGLLEAQDRRRSFQALLESAIAGETELEPLLRARLPAFADRPLGRTLVFDDNAHPTATRLRLSAPNRMGLLYLVSHTLSSLGCNIEMAYVATPQGSVEDEFFVTRDGRKLMEDDHAAIRAALLGGRDTADAA